MSVYLLYPMPNLPLIYYVYLFLTLLLSKVYEIASHALRLLPLLDDNSSSTRSMMFRDGSRILSFEGPN